MRIFFPNASILYPPRDGPHVHQFQLIKNLIDLGHEFVTFEPDENPLVTVRPKSPNWLFKAVRWADVIYCRTNEGLNAATRLTAPWHRLLIPRRTAVVWQMDLDIQLTVSNAPRSPAKIKQDIRALRQRAKRVDAAIGVSRKIADGARDWLGIEHVIALQNGSDPQQFNPDIEPIQGLNKGPDKLNVIWIGSHSNAIHDAQLIQGLCAKIDQQRLPIQVHVVGRTAELFTQPYPTGLVMHGPVSYMELPKYLAAMDVGLAVYNIRYDGGSPLKLFDYLASGCVPICSPGDTMDEVLADQNAGYVGQWTAESLADQLMTLHRDRGLLARRSANGRKLIEKTYNWRAIAEKTQQIIQQALKRRRG